MNRSSIIVILLAVTSTQLGCSKKTSATAKPDAGASADTKADAGAGSARADLRVETLKNKAAYLTPQCYTKTKVASGPAANPCFTCHVQARAPNFVEDADLQQEYSFAEYALTNHWTNLFEDRSAKVAKISDEEIWRYVRSSNYFTEDNKLALVQRLAQLPKEWDDNGDGRWNGYTPDCYFNFDAEGFDRDASGAETGWRAYAYYPTPGTFWPTNGSTSDVLIRLPEVFRQTAAGAPSREVYKLNLAILEALFTHKDIAIDPTDESKYGVDLNKNSKIDTAREVVYRWAPLKNENMSYVGAAKTAQEAAKVHLAKGLFPEGTEFLHTVRYVDVADDGTTSLASRLKELRYAKKTRWLTYSELHAAADEEVKDKDDFPDRLKEVWGTGSAELGINNGRGWRLQGFIEDAQGDLRPQSFEEHVYCVGCHGGIGTNNDSMFTFARKLPVTKHAGGWFHWSQKNLKNEPEPVRADGRGEYSYYLQQNQAGDEFRMNDEVIGKFFDAKGDLIPAKADELKTDLTKLLWPSKARAALLNKAYRAIVIDQDFVEGRDATVTAPENVHRSVEEGDDTGVETSVTPFWRPNS